MNIPLNGIPQANRLEYEPVWTVILTWLSLDFSYQRKSQVQTATDSRVPTSRLRLTFQSMNPTMGVERKNSIDSFESRASYWCFYWRLHLRGRDVIYCTVQSDFAHFGHSKCPQDWELIGPQRLKFWYSAISWGSVRLAKMRNSRILCKARFPHALTWDDILFWPGLHRGVQVIE
jgi:hypothetical protein